MLAFFQMAKHGGLLPRSLAEKHGVLFHCNACPGVRRLKSNVGSFKLHKISKGRSSEIELDRCEDGDSGGGVDDSRGLVESNRIRSTRSLRNRNRSRSRRTAIRFSFLVCSTPTHATHQPPESYHPHSRHSRPHTPSSPAAQ